MYPDYVKPIKLPDNAYKVFMLRYSMKDEHGNPTEEPHDTFYRIAFNVAKLGLEEKKRQTLSYGRPTKDVSVEKLTKRFYNLLSELDFFPNSPTFTGAGTDLGQLSACFVMPIEDDMGRHTDGIFSILRKAVLVQQTGGGNGFSFSRIRPAGDLVRKSRGKATGPVGFMEAYDAAFGVVAQGGVRRGANMAILRVDHPDIEAFIDAKATEGKLTNFNISVGLTDKFMYAVQAGLPFDLVFGGMTYKTVDARSLFQKIIQAAWRNGEPGAFFIDTANQDNPLLDLFPYEATNPCGEQPLGPYESCNLGSINLLKHLVKIGDAYNIDWIKLRQTVRTATEFLDYVIDANKYVDAVPELKKSAHDSRRIGLGIMGLADVFYAMNVRYGNSVSLRIAEDLMEHIRFWSMEKSVELAQDFGEFPLFQQSTYARTFPIRSDSRNNLPWEDLKVSIRKFGIRNACQTTIAPTGTLATVASCEGYGCEPVFALGYIRHVKEADGDVDLRYISPSFERSVKEYTEAGLLTQNEAEGLLEQAAYHGSVSHIPSEKWSNPEVIAVLKNTFVVAADILPENHVKMQAALQIWVDSAISKTINMPNWSTVQDVWDVYMQAFRSGCKGITVYREGSRDSVVLETQATKDEKKASVAELTKALRSALIEEAAKEGNAVTGSTLEEKPYTKIERPAILYGNTVKQETPLGTAYVTTNRDEWGDPFEVFVNVGKAGSDIFPVGEAIGRLLSLLLRTPGPVNGSTRLQWAVEELGGIGGRTVRGFGPNRVASLPDGVAKALTTSVLSVAPSEQVELAPAVSNVDFCPECQSATLLMVEGCATCHSCGYKAC